jgi:hypothetical protein
MTKTLFSALLMVGGTACAFGQAVITSGGSQFGWTSATDANISGAAVRTGTTAGEGSVLKTAAGADVLFANWWWYRVNSATVPSGPFSDTREFALSRLQSKSVVGNTMTLNYTETTDGTANGAVLFDAALRYTITNNASGVLVNSDTFITNQSGSAMTLSIFGYVDYDVTTSNNNSATMVGDVTSGRMVVTNGGNSATYRFLDGSAYQVSAFSTVRGSLSNAGIDNLNNTGLPFGPGDFTGAVQWDITLQARESISILTSYSAVPEPASMAALGLGLAGIIARRRRKK